MVASLENASVATEASCTALSMSTTYEKRKKEKKKEKIGH